MELPKVYLDISGDQFEDWLRVLCHNTGYGVSIRTNGTRRRYEVTREGSTVAEIETRPLGQRLKVRTARIGIEGTQRTHAGVTVFASHGFIEHYSAAMKNDLGVTPESESDISNGFVEWVYANAGKSLPGLDPIVELEQPTKTERQKPKGKRNRTANKGTLEGIEQALDRYMKSESATLLQASQSINGPVRDVTIWHWLPDVLSDLPKPEVDRIINKLSLTEKKQKVSALIEQLKHV